MSNNKAFVQRSRIAVLVCLFPWLLALGLRFRLRNTSLLNLRFNFLGTTKQAHKLFSVYLILVSGLIFIFSWYFYCFIINSAAAASNFEVSSVLLLMFFALQAYVFIYPLFVCDLRMFMVNKAIFGDEKFTARLSRAGFVSGFVKAVLLFICILCLVTGIGVGMFWSAQVSSLELNTFAIALFTLGTYFGFSLVTIIPNAYWQVFIFNETFASMELAGQVRFNANLNTKTLAVLLITNALMVLLSLGFAYPWAAIRLAKYKLEAISYAGDLSAFEGHSKAHTNALG